MTARAEGDLARFAVEKTKLATEAQIASEFRPTKQERVSISRIDGLDCDDIVEVGLDVVERHAVASELHGWVEFTHDDVTALGLEIDYDEIPPRHANIVAWPGGKGKRLWTRQRLAKACNRKCLLDPPAVPGGPLSKATCEDLGTSGNDEPDD